MKFLVAFALTLAVASADVSHLVKNPSEEGSASVLRSEADVHPDGFHYTYETSNGIAASAQGSVKDIGSDHATQVVSGDYKYTSPDGTPIALSYVADENGFQPQGAHLPVPPEIPALIVRALEYNAAHPQAAEKVAPSYVAQAQAKKFAPSPFKTFGKL